MPKIAVIGAGMVGSTAAYSILHRGVARELILVDTDRARAEGEAMDLAHGVSFLRAASVTAGPLEAAEGADLVVIAAGRGSLPGQTRLDQLAENAARVRSICAALKTWRIRPVVIMVSNPVDLLTELAWRELGWANRIFGSGTSLDTSRLRLLLGEAYGFAPASIHGYVLGEHGDSEFPAWSTVAAGGLGIRRWPGYDAAACQALFERVRVAGYEVVKRKKATYFAIGAGVSLLAEAVLRDQRTIHAVSVPLSGQYGLRDVSLSLPCVLGGGGLRRVFEPELEPGERVSLLHCADVLKRAGAPCLG